MNLTELKQSVVGKTLYKDGREEFTITHFTKIPHTGDVVLSTYRKSELISLHIVRTIIKGNKPLFVNVISRSGRITGETCKYEIK